MTTLESNLLKLLASFKQDINVKSYQNIDTLIKTHGEYGLALENICSNIESLNKPIIAAQKDSIIELFKQMKFEPDEIKYYQEHIKTN